MITENHIIVERIYKALELLHDGEWRNLHDIARNVGETNFYRLKKPLEDLVKRDIILSWNNISDEEKIKARKRTDP